MSVKGKSRVLKRKTEEENKIFNERWTEDYFFVEHQHVGKSVCLCLICNETIAKKKSLIQVGIMKLSKLLTPILKENSEKKRWKP